MIRIKRITNLDRLADTVPKPKGAVPEFGLPRWKKMSLEHKIPMIPYRPEDAYNFTRRKIGRTLWTTNGSRTDFDLSDPYCREIKFPYEPLHDKHLCKFFSRSSNFKFLLKADLITEDMGVKCSLRDYNAYRKYLRKIHADRIKKELKKRNRLFVERTALCLAENQARKEAERLKKEEKFTRYRQRFVEEQLLQQELKVQKQREKAHKTVQRLKLLKILKQEERRLRNVKRKEHAERIRQRCKIAQHKIIDIKVNWKIKNKARKKTRNKRLMDIKQQKQKVMVERWIKKQHFQKEDIAMQKMLLQCIDTRRQKFIENYNKKINKETARMQKLLDDVKLFINCYTKRHLPDGRELICCKKYFQSNTNKSEARNNLQNSLHPSRKPMKQKKNKLLNEDDKGEISRQKDKHIARTHHNNKHKVK